jgi:hypothetical protein
MTDECHFYSNLARVRFQAAVTIQAVRHIDHFSSVQAVRYRLFICVQAVRPS